MSFITFIKLEAFQNNLLRIEEENVEFGSDTETYGGTFHYLLVEGQRLQGYFDNEDSFVVESEHSVYDALIACGVDSSDILCRDKSVSIDLDEPLPF